MIPRRNDYTYNGPHGNKASSKEFGARDGNVFYVLFYWTESAQVEIYAHAFGYRKQI